MPWPTAPTFESYDLFFMAGQRAGEPDYTLSVSRNGEPTFQVITRGGGFPALGSPLQMQVLITPNGPYSRPPSRMSAVAFRACRTTGRLHRMVAQGTGFARAAPGFAKNLPFTSGLTPTAFCVRVTPDRQPPPFAQGTKDGKPITGANSLKLKFPSVAAPAISEPIFVQAHE